MAYDKVKYNNEFNKNKYERLNIQVKKGMKEYIQKHADDEGYNSLNAYVNALIENDMTFKKHKITSEEQLVLNILRYTTEEDKKAIIGLAININEKYTEEQKKEMFERNKCE